MEAQALTHIGRRGKYEMKKKKKIKPPQLICNQVAQFQTGVTFI